MIDSSYEIQARIAKYMPMLLEIRKRLFFLVALFIIAASLGFIYFEPIIKKILSFYDLKGLNIVFTSPFQLLSLSFDSAIIIGIVAVIPFLILQTISFLKPALSKKEFNFMLWLIPPAIVLFVVGFVFGSWMMRFVVVLFSSQTSHLNVQNLWDIEDFIRNIFLTSLLLGITFEFPIVLTALIRLHVIKRRMVAKLRVPIYIILLLATIAFPPTDLLSDCLIFFPLAFLFEVTLLLNVKYE